MNARILVPTLAALALTLAGCGGDPTAGSESGSGSTAASTDTAGSSETGSSDSENFIMGVDMGVVVDECDIWGQDCPEGEKCTAWANDGGTSWNATRCVPIDKNPKQPGDECMVEGSDVSGFDDCDLGSLCFSVNPENDVGICIPMCQSSPDDPMCPDGSECHISNSGSLILCLALCHPLLQDCPSGGFQSQGCYPDNGVFSCLPDFSWEEGNYGDPCFFANVCDPGLFCGDASLFTECMGPWCCSEFCDLSEPTPCSGLPNGVECVPFWDPEVEPAPPGFENVGACGLAG